MRNLLVLALTIAVIASFIPAYAQEKGITEQVMVTTEKISGSVVSVDVEKAVVVVKQLKDEANSVYEDLSIQVLPFASISKGETIINLSDLKAEDKVTVECSKDTEGNLKAVAISVE